MMRLTLVTGQSVDYTFGFQFLYDAINATLCYH